MTPFDNNSSWDERRLRYFVFLLTLHTALLVASNAGGAKMIGLPGGLAASATVFSYVGTFIILDAAAELFGRAFSRLIIYLGLGALIVSVTFYELSIWAPPAQFWKGQEAYEATLGSVWRILLGGWVSYVISQFVDVWGFFHLKRTRLGARRLWWRSWGSTAFAQGIDTVVFMTIAFYGMFPLLPAIVGQYLLKLLLAAMGIPGVYVLVYLGNRYMKARS